jgi:hypothetical protein
LTPRAGGERKHVLSTSAADNTKVPAGPEQAAAPPKYDWADPKVPAGNAPSMPRWPLLVSGVVFGLWIIFLVAMAYIRVTTVSQ